MTTNARSLEFSVKHTAAVLTALGLTRSTIDRLQTLPAEALHDAFSTTYFQVEFEQDARARWGRLTDHDLKQIDLAKKRPARRSWLGYSRRATAMSEREPSRKGLASGAARFRTMSVLSRRATSFFRPHSTQRHPRSQRMYRCS